MLRGMDAETSVRDYGAAQPQTKCRLSTWVWSLWMKMRRKWWMNSAIFSKNQNSYLTDLGRNKSLVSVFCDRIFLAGVYRHQIKRHRFIHKSWCIVTSLITNVYLIINLRTGYFYNHHTTVLICHHLNRIKWSTS